MLNLSIKTFIETGTFFPERSAPLKEIQKNCDEHFGVGVVMYYFNQAGYKISFVYDAGKDCLMAQQIEITTPTEIQDGFLSAVLNLEDVKNKLNQKIDAIYGDDNGETVIFLKNGIHAHFNEANLCKITSEDRATRAFVENTMLRIRSHSSNQR